LEDFGLDSGNQVFNIFGGGAQIVLRLLFMPQKAADEILNGIYVKNGLFAPIDPHFLKLFII